MLRNHVTDEIINLNRKAITDDHYALFNSARAVLLTGGPAYQEKIYPNVYDLDLNRIDVPVLAYGLGWKGKLNETPQSFKFTPEAFDFVQRIHADGSRFSSARCHLTSQMLNANDVHNVRMTGCPAWYDETKLAQDYAFPGKFDRVVFSMPAVPQKQVPALLLKLSRQFRGSQKYLSFQAGFDSGHWKNSAEYTRWNRRMANLGRVLGFTPISFESDYPKFESFMEQIDFHVGYRVHSHIFSVSQRKTSLLIAEDSRGIGQVEAMGGSALLASTPTSEVAAGIDVLLDTNGAAIQTAVESMRATHGTMLEFLAQL